jgi:trehalose/maltose hydrolase-like predicted phosphorylase
VDLIQRCHTGLEMHDDVLWFNPVLPEELAGIRLRLRYRRHWLAVSITDERLTVSVDRGGPDAACIGYGDQVHEVAQGETLEIVLSGGPRAAGPARRRRGGREPGHASGHRRCRG